MQQIYEILPHVHFLYILPFQEGSLPCQLLLLQVRVQLFSTRGSSITWIYHMDICSYQKSRNNFQIFTSIFFSPKNTKLHIFPFMPYSRRVNGLGSDINQDFFSFIEAQLLTCCVRMIKLSDLSELQFCHY